MPARLVGGDFFVQHANQGFIAADFDGIGAIPFEAKPLTGAEYLIDLVGQPRLANSWWPGAVISEELATAAALRQQQALLTRQ